MRKWCARQPVQSERPRCVPDIERRIDIRICAVEASGLRLLHVESILTLLRRFHIIHGEVFGLARRRLSKAALQEESRVAQGSSTRPAPALVVHNVQIGHILKVEYDMWGYSPFRYTFDFLADIAADRAEIEKRSESRARRQLLIVNVLVMLPQAAQGVCLNALS